MGQRGSPTDSNVIGRCEGNSCRRGSWRKPTILDGLLADEIEAAAFTNLLMLGFDPALMERKHATSFHRRMFRKTNAKGMEIVLHFRMQRGSDPQCAQELALVWPIFDKPSARGFRKLATSLLQGLQV